MAGFDLQERVHNGKRRWTDPDAEGVWARGRSPFDPYQLFVEEAQVGEESAAEGAGPRGMEPALALVETGREVLDAEVATAEEYAEAFATVLDGVEAFAENYAERLTELEAQVARNQELIERLVSSGGSGSQQADVVRTEASGTWENSPFRPSVDQ